MAIDSLRGAIDEVVLLLTPLVRAADAPEDMLRLLGELGWRADSVPPPLADLGGAGADLIDAIVQGDELPAPAVLAAVGKFIAAIDAIRKRADTDFPDGVDIAAFRQTIGRDLLDYCVVEYLLGPRFRIGRLLKLIGLVRLFEVPANGLRRAYVRRFVDWAGAGTLLTDPLEGLRAAYGWGSEGPRLMTLLSDLGGALEGFGLDLSHFVLSEAQLEFVAAGAEPRPAGLLGLALDLNEALGVPPGGETGIQFAVRPPTATRGAAIVIMPVARLVASSAPDDDALTTLAVQCTADLAQGFAIVLGPGQAPEVATGFLGGAGSVAADLALRLRVPPPPGAPERVLVGAADASRLALHTLVLSAGVTHAAGHEVEAFAELKLDRLRVVIDTAEADGLIASLLGKGLSTEISLALRLSSVSGLHVGGSVGMQASFPVSLELGPVGVRALAIGLKPRSNGVDLDVGAALNVRLGPVTLVADGTGFRLAARFPDPPTGNLGPVDLGLDFLPPSGIGLSVNVPGLVSGGGFIAHDADLALYAGVLQLALHESINVSAFGLIATRLPDGAKGYSLLVFITADGFKPIQLGLGFTLLGVGGMVAIHRSFDEAVLRNGLANDTLGSLLFPRDPVANAGAIIRAVASAFPARSGSYMVGLLVRIGWFTPTLVVADLALIVEFGARKRILVLGRVRAALPSPQKALLRIGLDAIGVFDLDAGTAAIDAVLVDSRLLERFAITGAAALRARWSRPRSFALAIGGMHQGFTLPAQFPQLERVTLSLTTGDNPRLNCQAYFALTSNTVQFGAAAHLYAAAHGFSITGDAGFDVLIQLAPFHFLAEFFAGMQLKRGSTNLFKVKVEGALEGPAPLTVRAKCSFEILWWDVSIRVNATLAGGTAPALPAAVDVLAQLQAALRDARNWSAELPAAQTRVVALRDAPAGTALRVHPLATLVVRQAIVPLNLERDIDRFGDAALHARYSADRRRRCGQRSAARRLRAGTVLRHERRREAGRAAVRDDGCGADVRHAGCQLRSRQRRGLGPRLRDAAGR
jgi:hypothetical protein